MNLRGVVLAAVAIALGCAVAPAVAADWDHDANIDAAVLEVVFTYRLGGMVGLERLVEGCYGQVDTHEDPDDRLRQFEYCAGTDFAALRLARLEGPGTTPVSGGYFGMESLIGRVGRLASFLDDPNVGNQVIRAWSRAATEALERQGY
jgi:hypothetical protein